MKYFTAKGDSGTTKLFNCPAGVRLSKGERIFAALGELDELNSLIGLCRCVASRAGFRAGDGPTERQQILGTLRSIQENLFIIQAELGGSGKRLSGEKVTELETAIAEFSRKFPPISSFVISGATELSAWLDITRSVARRTERVYLRARTSPVNPTIGAYLNRLSSVLYVLARFATFAQGEKEEAPTYK